MRVPNEVTITLKFPESSIQIFTYFMKNVSYLTIQFINITDDESQAHTFNFFDGSIVSYNAILDGKTENKAC